MNKDWGHDEGAATGVFDPKTWVPSQDLLERIEAENTRLRIALSDAKRDAERLHARAYALLWDGDCGPDGIDLATDIHAAFKPLSHDSILAMAESAELEADK